MKPRIRINWLNFHDGFSDALCREKVLLGLVDLYDFDFCKDPDFLIVGCYGQGDLPPGDYVKIGFYTENLPPDLDNFDWFFGCEYEDLVNHPRYCKRVYGNLDACLFGGCSDPEEALRHKSRFCNFIYSTRVPLREAFFQRLNRHKFVHAPGKSMNNVGDELAIRSAGNWREAKRKYLRQFKFTIAFENSKRRGYHTEKLVDAFAANTVPIYWGDPDVSRLFNMKAFVAYNDYEGYFSMSRVPERRQAFRPFYREPQVVNKAFGHINEMFEWLEAFVNSRRSFTNLCHRILEIDNDDRRYCEMLAQPRLNPEVHQIRKRYFDTWQEIFRLGRTCRTGMSL
jgi:hypothetical protein